MGLEHDVTLSRKRRVDAVEGHRQQPGEGGRDGHADHREDHQPASVVGAQPSASNFSHSATVRPAPPPSTDIDQREDRAGRARARSRACTSRHIEAGGRHGVGAGHLGGALRRGLIADPLPLVGRSSPKRLACRSNIVR